MALKKRDTTGGFRPRLRVGQDIGLPAAASVRLDGVLERSLLSPHLHRILLGMARVRNAVSSFRLEGETVDLDRARDLLEGRAPASPSETGVARLARQYSELAGDHHWTLSVDRILELHQRLFDGILYDDRGDLRDDWVGALKSKQNYIVNQGSGSLRFTPTPPEHTRAELEHLVRWYDESRFSWLPPIVAAVFFAEFQAIHPFMDGNGRVGRLLNIAILKDLGCLRSPLIPLDTRFFRTAEKYYELLGTTNSGEEYHLWARYFVRQVEAAYRAAARQADLSPVVSEFSRESTRRVLRWVLAGTGEWFGRGDYSNPGHYSPPTLWAALDELKRTGILESIGQNKGRRYRLRSKFLAEVYSRRFH